MKCFLNKKGVISVSKEWGSFTQKREWERRRRDQHGLGESWKNGGAEKKMQKNVYRKMTRRISLVSSLCIRFKERRHGRGHLGKVSHRVALKMQLRSRWKVADVLYIALSLGHLCLIYAEHSGYGQEKVNKKVNVSSNMFELYVCCHWVCTDCFAFLHSPITLAFFRFSPAQKPMEVSSLCFVLCRCFYKNILEISREVQQNFARLLYREFENQSESYPSEKSNVARSYLRSIVASCVWPLKTWYMLLEASRTSRNWFFQETLCKNGFFLLQVLSLHQTILQKKKLLVKFETIFLSFFRWLSLRCWKQNKLLLHFCFIFSMFCRFAALRFKPKTSLRRFALLRPRNSFESLLELAGRIRLLLGATAWEAPKQMKKVFSFLFLRLDIYDLLCLHVFFSCFFPWCSMHLWLCTLL